MATSAQRVRRGGTATVRMSGRITSTCGFVQGPLTTLRATTVAGAGTGVAGIVSSAASAVAAACDALLMASCDALRGNPFGDPTSPTMLAGRLDWWFELHDCSCIHGERSCLSLWLATFRRKIQFSSLRSIAPRKSKPAGGDRRLENRLTVTELVKAPSPLVPSRNRC
jgi:hypothetical protein